MGPYRDHRHGVAKPASHASGGSDYLKFGPLNLIWYGSGMRDVDVRRVLMQQLDACYGADSNTLIVQELGLCRGSVRADVAVINGILKGYEIKSERDTLARLECQAETYNRVFDTVTVVAAIRHIGNIERIVPDWWGIQAVARNCGSILELARVRDESQNYQIDPIALVQLLWRDEVMLLLRNLPMAMNLKRKPREFLWRTLVELVPVTDLKKQVRECLRNRASWRAHEEQTLNDERSLPCATSSGFLSQPSGLRSRRYTRRPN